MKKPTLIGRLYFAFSQIILKKSVDIHMCMLYNINVSKRYKDKGVIEMKKK